MRAILSVVMALGLLAACQSNDLKQPPVPLGDFALGVNVAVTTGRRFRGPRPKTS